jgi:hypothetical protein
MEQTCANAWFSTIHFLLLFAVVLFLLIEADRRCCLGQIIESRTALERPAKKWRTLAVSC